MRKITLLLLSTWLSGVAFAQSFHNDTSKQSLKEKLYTGGQVGLTLGSYTNIMISPEIGARLNNKVYAGFGIDYQYTKNKRIDPTQIYHQYGLRLFSQYNIVTQLFAHAELAAYNYEYQKLGNKQRSFVPFFLVGGGYRHMLSPRSFVSFRIVFDVLQHKNSPYSTWDPIYSIGFGIGI